jgi:sialate O-acetylesterase
MTELPEKLNWHVMSPDNAGGCCAVGFYFARKVNAETNVPIGVLGSAQGGSCIESWLSPEAIDNYPQNADLAQRYHTAIDAWRDSLPLDELRKWLAQVNKPLADAGIFDPALAELEHWQVQAHAAVANNKTFRKGMWLMAGQPHGCSSSSV